MSRPGRAEIVLLLISLLASSALAEIYLRLFNPIDSLLYEIHPRYLFRLKPGARRLFYKSAADDGPDRVLLTVNSRGFRGPEIRAKRWPRVIVYGDSFVMASLSQLEETFAKQLERALATRLNLPVEAINAGVAGYGPDQVSLRLEDEIAPLSPDLVIVAIYAGNDFGDLVRNKIYRLGPDGSLSPNRYRLSRIQVEQFPDQPQDEPWSMLVRGISLLFKPSRTTAPAEPRSPEERISTYLLKAAQEYADTVVEGNPKVRRLFADTYGADVSLTPDAPSARYSTRLMEQVLLHIAGVARSQRVPLLFVFIPAASDVCTGPQWSEWSRAVAAYPSYRRNGLTRILSDLADRNGLEAIDLFPVFSAADADALYFPKDRHWNAAGERLAADQAARRVVERRLLEGATLRH